MANICIIPARGGSKRIPRKNIKDFLGKPIIAYSIEAAIKSEVYDLIMVSTDDEEIKEVAQFYGAEVPFLRSHENSNDFATTSAVLEEVLSKYEPKFNLATCLYPTAPFVNETKLRKSVNSLGDGVDATFSITRFSTPIQRALKMDGDAIVKMIQPEFRWSRSQDLEPFFFDAGQFYSFKIKQFMKTKDLWEKNCMGIEVSELEVQDIDSITDWKLAELKYQLLKDETR